MTNPAAVSSLRAWEALDSRGTPTVACEIRLVDGTTAVATAPSGASTGTHEAHELRDGGDRYNGRGVLRAVENAQRVLAPAIIGIDVREQAAIDGALCSRAGDDLGRVGANAVVAISIATLLAAAKQSRAPLYQVLPDAGDPLLPMPMFNIISGGLHAGWGMDVQDVLAVPLGASSFREALEWGWRVRRAAAEIVAERGLISALVADEGGLGPALDSGLVAVEIVSEAIDRAGLDPGDDVGIAIDVAATQLLEDGRYRFGTRGSLVSAAEVVDELTSWANAHPIVSIEDPLAEDDWDGWSTATRALGHLQLLGDDLFVTHPERLARGVEAGVANAILVKTNQNGTLSGTHDVIRRAQAAGYRTVLSARSGETEEHWLADLAVGWRTGQIKVGSTMRSERTAKWNRLLHIEAELGAKAEFAGGAALRAAVV